MALIKTVADMFIVCGVLYAVDRVKERDTRIRFALDLYKVTFIYYVSTIWGFFNPLLPYVSIFYVLKISNKDNFWPPSP